MADHELDANPPVDGAGEETAAHAGGIRALLARLKVPLVIGVIVLIECLAAYLFLPASAESAAVAAAATDSIEESHHEVTSHGSHDSHHESSHGGGGHAGSSGGHGPAAGEYVEVELGKFSVMAFHPNTTNSTLVIDFHLYGAVKHADEADFTHLFEANEKRFRDEIITTVRSAELAELTDPGLGLIKRKFLATTNRLLGKPLLQAVVFSDFSFIEQ